MFLPSFRVPTHEQDDPGNRSQSLARPWAWLPKPFRFQPRKNGSLTVVAIPEAATVTGEIDGKIRG